MQIAVVVVVFSFAARLAAGALVPYLPLRQTVELVISQLRLRYFFQVSGHGHVIVKLVIIVFVRLDFSLLV